MNNNRFYISKTNSSEIADLLLINKRYDELDSCIDEGELAEIIFIDTKEKTFFFLDNQCLQNTVDLIADKYNEQVGIFDLSINSNF